MKDIAFEAGEQGWNAAPVISAPPARSIRKPASSSRVESVRALLGRDVTLVPVSSQSKAPTLAGWQNRTVRALDDPEYLEKLEEGNIAILMGAPSGGLISVDLDSPEAEARFWELNLDTVESTLRSYAARGCNYWFRIDGGFPEGCHKIKDQEGKSIGELRAGSCITIIGGVHPSGCEYKHNPMPPLKIAFDAITWPEDWILPWKRDPYDELGDAEGQPFTATKTGIAPNEPWFVAKYQKEHDVIFEPALNSFYEYDEKSGLWTSVTAAAVGHQFSRDIKTAADKLNEPKLLPKRNQSFLSSLTNQLRGAAEGKNFFDVDRPNAVHVRNGVLSLESGEWKLCGFDRELRSLSQIPFDYDLGAECPRFKSELLDLALPEHDRLLLQKYCGQILLGANLSQTILLLEGGGGTGKGTISEIIDGIVGIENVAELRSGHLDGRFETAGYVGKKLLAGRDVPGNFLSLANSKALHKLTGNDLIDCEAKGANKRTKIRGNFCVLITANTRLIVRVDGDISAWRRRLLVIPFEQAPPSRPIPKFAELLLREEGPGILRWMLEGARLLLEDLEANGRIILDEDQVRRINDLLNESDSIAKWAQDRVEKDSTGEGVPTTRLYRDYESFCGDEGFDPIPERIFARQIKTALLDAHGARASENVLLGRDPRSRVRGYKGIKLRLGYSQFGLS